VDERRETMGSGEIAKPRRIGWVNRILLTLFFIGMPSFVHADISDILLKFYPILRPKKNTAPIFC
jgi:hypothetical protein